MSLLRRILRLLSIRKEIAKQPPTFIEPYDSGPKIRIQFEDFKLENFDITPVWKFVHGEEEDAEDETTLKPCYGLIKPDPKNGMYIVKGTFISASGKKYDGLLTPSAFFDFGYIQPHIFTTVGLVPLYTGIVPIIKEKVDAFYRKINETKDTLFPLKFSSDINCKGESLIGKIEGFMWRPHEEIIIVK